MTKRTDATKKTNSAKRTKKTEQPASPMETTEHGVDDGASPTETRPTLDREVAELKKLVRESGHSNNGEGSMVKAARAELGQRLLIVRGRFPKGSPEWIEFLRKIGLPKANAYRYIRVAQGIPPRAKKVETKLDRALGAIEGLRYEDLAKVGERVGQLLEANVRAHAEEVQKAIEARHATQVALDRISESVTAAKSLITEVRAA